MCTIHLVSLGKGFMFNEDENNLDNDLDNATKLIIDKYKGIKEKLNRGDIIENVDDSGYRSEGVYMWNGLKLIDLCYDIDDYGSPSKEFIIFTEFHPFYWHTIERYINWEHDSCSNMYWHSPTPQHLVTIKNFIQPTYSNRNFLFYMEKNKLTISDGHDRVIMNLKYINAFFNGEQFTLLSEYSHSHNIDMYSLYPI